MLGRLIFAFVAFAIGYTILDLAVRFVGANISPVLGGAIFALIVYNVAK